MIKIWLCMAVFPGYFEENKELKKLERPFSIFSLFSKNLEQSFKTIDFSEN